MLNQGTGTWPRRRARQAPDAVALAFRGTGVTYRELDERVTRLAHALRAQGVGPGDRVALLSANHPAYLEVLFAAGLLGAVFVPLNARLTTPRGGVLPGRLRQHRPGPFRRPHGRRRRRRDRGRHHPARGPRRCARRPGRRLRGDRRGRSHRPPRPPGHARGPVLHHVHLRHDGPAQGCRPHPRERGVRGDEPDRRPRLPVRRGGSRRRTPVPHRRIELRRPAHPAQGRHRAHRGRLRAGPHPPPDRNRKGHLLVRGAHDARRDERPPELGPHRPEFDPALDRGGRTGSAADPADLHRPRRPPLPGIRADRDRSGRADPHPPRTPSASSAPRARRTSSPTCVSSTPTAPRPPPENAARSRSPART